MNFLCFKNDLQFNLTYIQNGKKKMKKKEKKKWSCLLQNDSLHIQNDFFFYSFPVVISASEGTKVKKRIQLTY